MALASAKYVEPSIGFISLGTEGARMRAVEAIATPIVTLWYKFRRYLPVKMEQMATDK
jgi:hypothetical protein